MKKSIFETSKIFESQVRIQIISNLMKSDLSYKQLKGLCVCTDGNMTTHTKKLKEAGFLTVTKQFQNNRPLTTYHLTDEAREQFHEYIQILNHLWKQGSSK